MCLEPLGHFPVEPDMEKKIISTKLTEAEESLSSSEGASNSSTTSGSSLPSSTLLGSGASSFHTLSELSSDIKKALGSAGSGVVVNQPMKWPGGSGHVAAFSGKGHTLSGDSADEPDPTPTNSRVATDGSPNHGPMDVDSDEDATLFNPDTRPDTMDIDTKTIDKPSTSQTADNSTSQDAALFERIGPGYTRLNRSKTTEANRQSEMFQTIASSIQSALSEEPGVKVGSCSHFIFLTYT